MSPTNKVREREARDELTKRPLRFGDNAQIKAAQYLGSLPANPEGCSACEGTGKCECPKCGHEHRCEMCG